MNNTSQKASSDFVGFLDGFQARNLVSIQRDITLELSEMQTRLAVIRNKAATAADFPSLKNDFDQIEQALQDNSMNIIDRLLRVGELVTDSLIKHGAAFKSNPDVLSQTRGLIRAYLESAEISRHDGLIAAAVKVTDALRDMHSASPQ